MNRAERLVYVELASEIGSLICVFCKYPEWEHTGCCEGYPICAHPVENVCEQHEEIEPGDDCWGFRPGHPVGIAVDIVSAILSSAYGEWAIKLYSKTAVTVYGRDATGAESKVRIGHAGRSNQSLHPTEDGG